MIIAFAAHMKSAINLSNSLSAHKMDAQTDMKPSLGDIYNVHVVRFCHVVAEL